MTHALNSYNRPAGMLPSRLTRLCRAVPAVASAGSQVARASAEAAASPSRPQNRPLFYTQFSIYKKSGAVALKLIQPTWSQDADGNYRLEREGTFLLEFASARTGSGTAPGERAYNWDKKEVISLSATEMAELTEALGNEEVSFYHDPFMGSDRKGQIGKGISLKPLKRPGEFYLGITVKENQTQRAAISIPVSRGEMSVFRQIKNDFTCYLLGLEEIRNQEMRLLEPPPPRGQAPY